MTTEDHLDRPTLQCPGAPSPEDPGAPGPGAPGPEDPGRLLMKSAELLELLGVGRSRFYELIWEPGVPRPIRLGSGETEYRWFTHEIHEWLLAQPRVAAPAERRLAAVHAATDAPAAPDSHEADELGLRPAGPRRVTVEPDDGLAAEPVGPDDLVLVPRDGQRAS